MYNSINICFLFIFCYRFQVKPCYIFLTAILTYWTNKICCPANTCYTPPPLLKEKFLKCYNLFMDLRHSHPRVFAFASILMIILSVLIFHFILGSTVMIFGSLAGIGIAVVHRNKEMSSDAVNGAKKGKIYFIFVTSSIMIFNVAVNSL